MKVEVIDQGIGIEPHDLKRLFKDFSKAKSSTAVNLEGIGLGLTITKALVEAYNGTIAVHSDGTNKGTRFTFTM